MKARRGIATMMMMAACCAAPAAPAWAQAGVTEKVGQTRVTPVPAPLPQAVPAGQGVRPSAVPRPSVAQPAPPEAVVMPKPPEVASRGTLPSTSLTRTDVEVAPVAPSLAAHGMPIMAAAPPSAGMTSDLTAGAKPPRVEAAKPPTRSVAKPASHPSMASKAPTTKVARKPADAQPTLRPDPAPASTARSKSRKSAAAARGSAKAAPAHRKADAAKPVSTAPAKAHKNRRRLNDGSQP